MTPFWKRSRKAASAIGKIHMDLDHKKVICPKCKKEYTGQQAYNNLYICPGCGKYMPIGAKERLTMVLDEATFEPWFEEVTAGNPLGTPGYEEKLEKARKKSGNSEAVTIGYGKMSGGDLLKELLYYGVSSISLSTTGSDQQGVRACTSRMRDDLYDVMAERMKAFNQDHPLK